MCNGGLGLIYKVKSFAASEILALKCPKNRESLFIDSMKLEIDILTSLNSPFIIDILSCDSYYNFPYITMPWAHGGSLDTWYPQCDKSIFNILKLAFVDDDNSISISRDDLSSSEYACRVLDITMQLVSGLVHAHKQGVIHADIKPGNILVMEVDRERPYLNIKICDFNFSISNSEEEDAPQHTKDQSGGYRSPEQVRKEKSDEKADSWSVGLVILELLTKCKFYDKMRLISCSNYFPFKSRVETAEAHPFDEVQWMREELSSFCIELVEGLISGCLKLSKDDRLSMEEIYAKCSEITGQVNSRIDRKSVV
jgi:serine/threonine protein kinase